MNLTLTMEVHYVCHSNFGFVLSLRFFPPFTLVQITCNMTELKFSIATVSSNKSEVTFDSGFNTELHLLQDLTSEQHQKFTKL